MNLRFVRAVRTPYSERHLILRDGTDGGVVEIHYLEGGAIDATLVLFEGGPVELDALIALARLNGEAGEAWSAVVGDLGSIDLGLDPAIVTETVTELRVFRGYSGWGPGQLDRELGEGAWMVLPSERNDVFSDDPSELWRAVIRRQGGRIAWIANAPDDLSAN